MRVLWSSFLLSNLLELYVPAFLAKNKAVSCSHHLESLKYAVVVY